MSNASTGDARVDNIMPSLYGKWLTVPFDNSVLPHGIIPKKLKAKEMSKTGKVPVIDQGENFVSGYTNNEQYIYQGSLPLIIFGDHTRRIKYVDFPFAVGADGTKLLHPIKAIEPKLFYYYLNSLNLASEGYSRHYKFLREISVPIPPLNEQRRIVAKLEILLERVNDCRKRLDNIPIILKRFRQSVLSAACSGKLTEDWRNRNGHNASPWPVVDFFSFIILQRGYDLPLAQITPGKYPVLTSAGISGYHSIFKARGPGVVTGRSGSVGNVHYVQDDYWPHNTTLYVKNFQGNIPKYVYYFLLGFDIRQYSASTAVPTLNRNNLRGIEIAVPPQVEQTEIIRRIEELFALADKLETHYAKAKSQIDKLTQSILAKAFRGELVPQDPNDEPASALLARIKQSNTKHSKKKRERKTNHGLS